MTEYETPPSGAAQELLDNAYLSDLLSELETAEMRKSVLGGFDDHDIRTKAALRFGMLQDLRRELARRAAGTPVTPPKSKRP